MCTPVYTPGNLQTLRTSSRQHWLHTSSSPASLVEAAAYLQEQADSEIPGHPVQQSVACPAAQPPKNHSDSKVILQLLQL